MNFNIENADFLFTLETQQMNGNNVLTSFTATADSVTYNCYIQLVAVGEVETEFCCGPLGCTAGPCRSDQIKAQSASTQSGD